MTHNDDVERVAEALWRYDNEFAVGRSWGGRTLGDTWRTRARAAVVALDLPARDRHVKAQALREVADDWQMGGWADAPRRADPAAERIANAQYVTDWLRRRADEIEADR